MNTTKILRRIIAGGAVVVLGASLTSCSRPDDNSSSGGGAKTLTVASFPMGNSLDPWGSQVSTYTAQAAYDTLTRLEPNGEIGPWLAESWDYTDPTTLELKLRSGVKFTDGTPFDAEAVKANLEYGKAANPKNSGSAGFVASIGEVTVVDEHTVSIALTEANPDLPWAFSQQAGWMVSPQALENPDELTSGVDGSGPYILDESKTTAQQTYTFTPNPDYWAADQVERFDTLVIKIMGDPNAMANAARTGAADFLVTPDPSVEVGDFTKAYGGAVSILGLVFQDFDGTISAPIKDVRVRQALNYAIDRQAILDNVLKGAGVINGSVPFGPESDGYTAALDTHYGYDPDKAKSLLADAGYPDGFKLKILVNAQFASVAQAIGDYLRKVGIDVELSSHSTDIIQQTQSGDWAVAHILTGVTGQPYSDVKGTMTDVSIFNPAKYSDPKISSLLADAAAATDDAARSKAYTELATYAQDQAWFLTPALLKTGYAYDGDKVKIDAPPTVVAPDLWYMSPA